MSPEPAVILAVDDEAAILRFLKAYLETEGYVFLEATSGRKALELAASRDPDVILLDLGLPDLDGQQVLEALPPWSRARVIVVSRAGTGGGQGGRPGRRGQRLPDQALQRGRAGRPDPGPAAPGRRPGPGAAHHLLLR